MQSPEDLREVVHQPALAAGTVWIQVDTIFGVSPDDVRDRFVVKAGWRGRAASVHTEPSVSDRGNCVVRQQVRLEGAGASVIALSVVRITDVPRAAGVDETVVATSDIVATEPRALEVQTYSMRDADGLALPTNIKLRLWPEPEEMETPSPADQGASSLRALRSQQATSPDQTPASQRRGVSFDKERVGGVAQDVDESVDENISEESGSYEDMEEETAEEESADGGDSVVSSASSEAS